MTLLVGYYFLKRFHVSLLQYLHHFLAGCDVVLVQSLFSASNYEDVPHIL
jgi:hypothetical protein